MAADEHLGGSVGRAESARWDDEGGEVRSELGRAGRIRCGLREHSRMVCMAFDTARFKRGGGAACASFHELSRAFKSGWHRRFFLDLALPARTGMSWPSVLFGFLLWKPFSILLAM